MCVVCCLFKLCTLNEVNIPSFDFVAFVLLVTDSDFVIVVISSDSHCAKLPMSTSFLLCFLLCDTWC
jgi:hypothetical protein